MTAIDLLAARSHRGGDTSQPDVGKVIGRFTALDVYWQLTLAGIAAGQRRA
jgi:hypothetical protein